MNVMVVFNGLSAVFAAVSAIALYATYLGTPEAKWSIYLGGAFCTVIAVHQTISFFLALGIRQKFIRKRGGSGRLVESNATHSPPVLNGETAPIITAPSVTEKTTELLEPPRPPSAGSADGLSSR